MTDLKAALASLTIDDIERELGRRSLREFIPMAWPILEPGREFVSGWVIDAMCEHLEAVTNGEIRRLIITVPPGSMKTLTVRVMWPAWEWISRPYNRFIAASYASSLSVDDNRKCRDLIMSDWYRSRWPHVKLKSDSEIVFRNDKEGSMRATSVDGIATGRRGDRFIIDDPHNVKDGESDLVRGRTLRWFREVVPSRVNDLDKSAFIIVMQRVHHDDVANAAIEMGYEHLMIPMHFDPERAKPTSIGWRDPRTEVDELMWPDRFSAKGVADLTETLGPYAAAAQLEQRPTPRKGGHFDVDEIRIIDDIPVDEEIQWVRSWDLAGTKDGGAYSAGALCGWRVQRKRFIVADVRRFRMGPGETFERFCAVAESDGEEMQILIPQDPGQAGKSQARQYKTDLPRHAIKSELQSGDKVTRSNPLASCITAGNCDLVRGEWNRALLDEMRQFPLGKFKDQVDAVASAYNHVAPKRRAGTGLHLVRDQPKNPLAL